MKKLVHLFGYLFRRQLSWVLSYWVLVVVLFWQLDRSSIVNLILVGVVLLAFMIVLRLHDHLEGGVLIGKPIARRALYGVELIYLFCVLIGPLGAVFLFVLSSYESARVSYFASLLLLAFLGSQVVLWYVAGKLAKSSFDVLILLFLCYAPVFLLWGVVEYLNRHDSIEITVYLVLGVVGILSLFLVAFSFRPPTRNLLFVGSAAVSLLALSGVRWDVGEKATFDSESDSISIKFSPSPSREGNPASESHWDVFEISSLWKDVAFVPKEIYDHPFGSWRSHHQLGVIWDQVEEVMINDLILRSLPANTDLRGVQQTLRHSMENPVFWKEKKVAVKEDGEALVVGHELRLLEVGKLPLKKGKRCFGEGYGTKINELVFSPERLWVGTQVSWVMESFFAARSERVRAAWVLYSPSAKRGVLVHGHEIYSRRVRVPGLLKIQRAGVTFPLPETFSDSDDVELRVYFLEEGERKKFRVPIPAGEYLVR